MFTYTVKMRNAEGIDREMHTDDWELAFDLTQNYEYMTKRGFVKAGMLDNTTGEYVSIWSAS